MSGFDENPFADPFAESSIRQATQPTSTGGLDNYDPFAQPPPSDTTTTVGAPQNVSKPNTQPATVTPTSVDAPPPAYTPTAQQHVSTAEFQRRQEELERKAQELARKEEELRTAGQQGARQNNWPPLPSVCPVGPCFYQDINVDIPLEFQKIVRMLYYLWIFHALLLLLNILGGLAMFIAFGEGTTFGLAILYFFIFTPFSYICWFRPIYKAFRSDSSFNFMVFFFVFFFQLIISAISAIGFPSMGSCGWIGVGTAFHYSKIGLGVFLILVAIADTFIAGYMAVMLIWVHRIYRSTGASFAKAQAEFAQGVMRNETIQNVAADAATAAVRNQFAAQGANTTNTAAPRF